MNNFEALGLNSEVVKAISALGFEAPSEIQEKSIPQLLSGKTDFVGLAQTGTGKTAAFGLPLAHLTNFSSRSVQALVVCPTRELCLQITKDIQAYTKYIKNAGVTAIYGGASVEGQLRELKQKPQIIVATPGRLVDFINRRAIDLSDISHVVFDEADEMLNMGFKDDIDAILEKTPSTKNTWLFSATMPKEVATIAKKYMHNPFEVTIGKKGGSAKNLDHHYFVIDGRHRYGALKRLLDFYPDIFGLIFCKTRRNTKEIAEKLAKEGYNVDSLHGDLSQQQRDMVMTKFRDRTIQVLVATDVAARGLDVDDITHVIHYQLPDEVENYTHRSGRTARAGKSGFSLALISSNEIGKIKQIEKIMDTKFVHSLVPTGQDVCANQLISMVKSVKDVKINEKEIEPYMGVVHEMLEDMSKEEIIQSFVSVEFNRFLEYYRNAPDLNKTVSKRDASREPRERSGRSRDDENMTRLFINAGDMDKVGKGEMVKMICETGNVTGDDIGRIDVKREFSFVDVKNEVAVQVVNGLSGHKVGNRSIRAEVSENKRSSGSDRGRRTGGGSRSSDRGGSGNFSKRFSKDSGGGRRGDSGKSGGRGNSGGKRRRD